MELNLVEIWQTMPTAVRIVVIVLTAQAVASIAVVIDRSAVLTASRRRSRTFAAAVYPMIDEGRYTDALDLASAAKGSFLAVYLYTGLHHYVQSRGRGASPPKAATMANRALERKGESVSASLHRGMNVLASTGSTAPFVGLLGTVLGILNAFKLIAASGSGGISTIGGAIGEALVVTGYGLIVAIPTVLLFNWLSGKIANYETGLANAASEMVDRLEFDQSLAVESAPPVTSPVPSAA